MIPVEFTQILIALGLGLAIGLERTFAHKTAGMRTYGLVAMGSAIFIILAQFVAPEASLNSPGIMYVMQGLIIGIGFIGGGAILHNHEHTSGLTTAAGLWITAGIGAAVGFGYTPLAIFITLLTLFTFTVLWFVEHLITKAGK